jgi:hypothetical protein
MSTEVFFDEPDHDRWENWFGTFVGVGDGRKAFVWQIHPERAVKRIRDDGWVILAWGAERITDGDFEARLRECVLIDFRVEPRERTQQRGRRTRPLPSGLDR